ncbi:hypothetical protein JD844_016792 [Phrynosoma platyrhinos]|uniref:Serpin domain-containing protein n=1 Tax=Phrynosoma platyrhinos TaxID=52577 RepID=A0ABQ7SKX4_PHRPL|nr:hypothetical protein JD844_016792 [Phrynosoma platyrhinos]
MRFLLISRLAGWLFGTMAFPSEADFFFDFFHLIRNNQHNENILFSPLSISAALHLLYNCRGDSAPQTEMLSGFNQDKKGLSSASRQHLEEPPSCNALEGSQRWHFMYECSVISEISETAIQETQDKESGRAQEALPKSLEEDCELCETKKKLSITSPLPASKRDDTQEDGNLTHVISSTIGHPSSDEDVSSQFVLWSKMIPNCEAVKVLSQEETAPEGEASHKLVSYPENPKGSLTQRNMAAEDVRPPSFYSVQTAAKCTLSTSFHPSTHTEHEVAKLGSTSEIFLPNSEVSNRQPVTESVKTTTGTAWLFYTEDVGLLRRYNENVLQSQEQPSMEELTEPKQANPLGSQQKLSQFKSVASSDKFSILPVSSMETVAGNMQKSQMQICSYHVDSMENEDSCTKFCPPFAPPSYEMNDGPRCNILIQTPEDTSSQVNSDRDISSHFLPRSEDFPKREENEIIHQEQSSPADQIRSLEPPKVSFLNHTDALNTHWSSDVDGATRTMLNNDAILTKFQHTINQKIDEDPSGKEEISKQIPLSNAGLIARLSHSTGDYRVNYRFNQPVSELLSSPYYLPWKKYLTGRQQREALIRSCYLLRQNSCKIPVDFDAG